MASELVQLLVSIMSSIHIIIPSTYASKELACFWPVFVFTPLCRESVELPSRRQNSFPVSPVPL